MYYLKNKRIEVTKVKYLVPLLREKEIILRAQCLKLNFSCEILYLF